MPLAEVIKLLSDNNSESLCSSISDLESILSDHGIYEQNPDLLHKYRVRISSLFKSKVASSRLLACRLSEISAKSHWDTLFSHGNTWTGLMLTIVSSQDNPDSVRGAAIASLSTIFSLTQGKSDLTRTITTRALPGFIRTLCQIARSRPALLGVSIDSLNTILLQHPTTFRPIASDYLDLIQNIFVQAREVGLCNIPVDIRSVARGYVLLHRAATKGNEANEWINALQNIIESIKFQIDGTFNSSLFNSINESVKNNQLVNISEDLFKNLRTISVLFTILQTFFQVSSKTRVVIPLANLIGLFRTILSANPVLTGALGYNTVVRSHCITCLQISANTFKQSLLPFIDDLILDISTIMRGRLPDDIKLQLLDLSTAYLRDIVKQVPESMKKNISKLAEESLRLLKFPDYTATSSAPDFTQNPETFLRQRKESSIMVINDFFVALLMTFPDMPLPIRGKIDEHFILTSYQKGIEISAVFPGSAKYSILPMAVNRCNDSHLLEVLMHPRLPLSQGYSEHVNGYSLVGQSQHIEPPKTENIERMDVDQEFEPIAPENNESLVDSVLSGPTINHQRLDMSSMNHLRMKTTNEEITANQSTGKQPIEAVETVDEQKESNEEDEKSMESDIEIPEIEIDESDDE